MSRQICRGLLLTNWGLFAFDGRNRKFSFRSGRPEGPGEGRGLFRLVRSSFVDGGPVLILPHCGMQHISQLSANVLHGVLFVQVLPCPRWSGGSGLWRGGRRHACSLRAGAALLSLQPVLFVCDCDQNCRFWAAKANKSSYIYNYVFYFKSVGDSTWCFYGNVCIFVGKI